MWRAPGNPERGLLRQDVDRHRGLFHTDHAAAVFLNGVACTWNLARAGFTAQLRDQLKQLADAGGAQGMALGLQST